MQKRVHSRELKLEVIHQLASGEKRPAQICREYGLADCVLVIKLQLDALCMDARIVFILDLVAL
jgi:transposase-like protein